MKKIGKVHEVRVFEDHLDILMDRDLYDELEAVAKAENTTPDQIVLQSIDLVYEKVKSGL